MRLRLDQYLVANGLAGTRAKARDAILRGCVVMNGVVARKAGAVVQEGAVVDVASDALPYVSRGGLKLAHALDHFGYACPGAIILDVGASTGGFTDVCLERSASKVYAVDTGRGQLHQQLRADDRVVVLEGRDIRSITAEDIPVPVDAIVVDVSFISSTLVLPTAMARAGECAWLISLIKPQFEVGSAWIGKRGIVKDEGARGRAIETVQDRVAGVAGWLVDGVIPSPISGGGGNIEFLIGARRGC